MQDNHSTRQTTRVLLLEPDLFTTIGGGQSFYRRLVELNPAIQFTTVSTGAVPKNLPPNVLVVKFDIVFGHSPEFLSIERMTLFKSLTYTMNIAHALRDSKFDVVDYPNYSLLGLFAKPVFKHYNIQCSKFVLSMHGLLSESFERSWFYSLRNSEEISALKSLENLQFATSDVRYSISTTYIEECLNRFGTKIKYLNPSSYLETFETSVIETRNIPTEETVRIAFIGRLEKLKGVETAIDLVSFLPNDLKTALHIVGPDDEFEGHSAKKILKDYADARSVSLVFHGALPKSDIRQFLKKPTVVLLPSKYDTFNFVAWDSIAQCAPTFIGSRAGIVDFLESVTPDIPFFKIDLQSPFSSIHQLIDVIQNYALHRKRIADSLQTMNLKPSDDISSIYNQPSCSTSDHDREVASLFTQLLPEVNSNRLSSVRTVIVREINLVKRNLFDLKFGANLKASCKRLRQPHKLVLRYAIRSAKSLLSLQLVREAAAVGHSLTFRQIRRLKIKKVSKSEPRLFRSSRYKELAFEAANLGRLDVAAAYGLRVLRWSNRKDLFLEQTITWLMSAGFKEEAYCTELMYVSPEKIPDYLRKRLAELKIYREKPVEKLVDHRPPAFFPKVSVIVSAYNVADKIDRFVRLLAAQSLIFKKQLELVVIDSGSPGGQTHFNKIDQACLKSGIPYVLARSEMRETIQSAWNRGLSLSKAEFVTFLGVDETVTPFALEELASQLENNPAVDWVTGDSIVVDVSADGDWVRDVMTYNRKDLTRSDHILECAYFSYVGGLYRKDIHNRCGFYDESFSAAGDTEFKNRAQPFITVHHVPQVFGIFLNYPDERMTASPRAEIEDLRAWYLFRTPAGLEYITSAHDDRELYNLFKKTLGYRKSYCAHISYDLELAHGIADIVMKRGNKTEFIEISRAIERLYNALNSLDAADGAREKIFTYAKFRLAMRSLKKAANAKMPNSSAPSWALRENRFEQHSNIWLSQI